MPLTQTELEWNNDDFEEPIIKKSLKKVKKEQSEDKYGEPTVKKSLKRTDKVCDA